LHDAIGIKNKDIVDMLIACTDVDFSRKNKKGFNVLHVATSCSDVKLVDSIASRQLLVCRRVFVDL